MKLKVNYLRKINACNPAIEYYARKYGEKSVDVWNEYCKACADWQVWFLGNAELKVVKHLIDNGADVNAVDNEGWTALTYASGNGHTALVRMLLDSGAVNAVDIDGWTALTYASLYGHTAIVKLLKEKEK